MYQERISRVLAAMERMGLEQMLGVRSGQHLVSDRVRCVPV